MATIGVAFGNSTTSIAFVRDDGKVEVIADPDGDRFIASAISYKGDDEYNGSQAVAQLVRNSENTIVNFRDFIGIKYEDASFLHSAHAAKPLNVGGKVGYLVNGEELTVDEIAKRHLANVRAAAEDYLGEKVEGAVFTIPSTYSAEQIKALTEVAAAAGLPILQEVREQSAALLAHLSLQEQFLEDKIYVVTDFGGIRSDAAVIAVRGGIFTVLATATSDQLGGDVLDAALMEFFNKDFKKKYNVDALSNDKSWAKLKLATIITKRTLSNVTSAPCSIEALADGFDYNTTINRTRFELVGRSIFSQMAAFAEEVVTKAGLETLDVDAVLLTGGSSNIPKIARNLQFIFPESTAIIAPSIDPKVPNPNELNARGAALQASLISSYDSDEIAASQTDQVVGATQLAKPIGIKGADNEFITILPAHTTYPIKKSITLNASADSVLIEICEGKRTIKETEVPVEPDSEDEEDEEEEPDIIREVVFVPEKTLAKLGLNDIESGSEVEVIVNIRKEGKIQLTARSAGKVATGSISA